MWTELSPAYGVNKTIKNVLVAESGNRIILNFVKVLVLF